MKQINTSISTFKNMIDADYLYVDKTSYLYELVKEPFGQFFFSRPRRFGKSLTISTLESIFLGERELFKGLNIYEQDYDWKKYPVIHIDFGRSDSSNKTNLEKWLNKELRGIAEVYGVSITGSTPAMLFGELIKNLYDKFDLGVVILIDEYDRPVTHNIEDGKRFKEIRRMMEAFYQMIKGYEGYERFVFLTGITKLSQISIFSKLNNLTDISRSAKYAGMVGYTGDELQNYFAEYIADGAKHYGCTESELGSKLKYWYDGFKFSFVDTTVYNPVSVGRFFSENFEFHNYWYATATPVMLVNYAKKQCLSLEDISNAFFTEVSYNAFDISALVEENMSTQMLIQLLFQTGYLTFGNKLEDSLTEAYTLVYPNHEVQLSFEMELAAIYSGCGVSELDSFTVSIRQAAYKGNTDKIITMLKSFFAGIPYDLQLNYEKYYQSLLYLVFRMCGMDVEVEEETNTGRIDAVLRAGQFIYIIECKINKTAGEAIAQIDEKKYYEKFGIEEANGKKLIKVGINFSSDKSIRNMHIIRKTLSRSLRL